MSLEMKKCNVLLSLVHLFFGVSSIVAATTGAGNETDYLALSEFKAKIVKDPQNVMKSWNDSMHFCNWEGVTCGSRQRRVTILNLQSKGLSGSLPPHIGNMSFLTEITLQNNTLQGNIPSELGRLLRLQVLNLGNNSFEGKIPANLSSCSNLTVLRLSYNKLVGQIPTEITSFSRLRELWIHNNYLTGGIPSSTANLSLLETLSASDNFFGGRIPDSLGKLNHLSAIGLGRTNLSGIIPPSIYNISSISIFSMPYNSLSGKLPSNIGLLLPNLEFLQVSGNQLEGSIPISLSNASKLERISIGRNKFTGKVGVHFGSMQRLVLLILAENNLGSLEGGDLNFITSLANCSSLVRLHLSRNQFKGVLPNSIANLSSTLEWMSIDENQIHGSLPPGLSNLVNLSTMDLQFNKISGTLPTEFGKLQKLQRLFLNQNRLSGTVPPSMGNLSLLNELHLQQNQLEGTIPSSLGNCHELLFLNLSRNKLNGSIPKQLFSIQSKLVGIDLSENHLVESLPSQIGNLFNLNTLDVSQNKLSGEIPINLGQCNSLEFLYMGSNNFQGTIPGSLASLRGLKLFDLSKNNISGKIPEFLENLALEFFNMSFNDFEGEVPAKGVFASKKAISVEGNKKLCGGIPELQLPKCIIQTSKKQKSKRHLVKIVVIALSSASCVIVLLAFLSYRCRKTKRQQSPDLLETGSLYRLSYDRILKATDGFSSTNLVGVGSFGSVYKGIFSDGVIVAIKVFNPQQQGAVRSFMAECKALRNVRHRNLVKIITSCSSIDFQGIDFRALVYEYMPNGNLDQWLHQNSKIDVKLDEHQNLNLLQRISIALDVGNALDYLHRHCHKPIIHCDLKPSNILLDNDMTAHVGDFGLAKFLSELTNPVQSSSIGVRGTIGYAAPEYGFGSEVSTSGDVYSYGILLLEMMTGKKPTDDIFVEGLNIQKFARMALLDQVLEVADPSLLQEEARVNCNQSSIQTRNHCIVECLISVIRVGLACSMEYPHQRMDISNAVNELQTIKDKFIRENETVVSA